MHVSKNLIGRRIELPTVDGSDPLKGVIRAVYMGQTEKWEVDQNTGAGKYVLKPDLMYAVEVEDFVDGKAKSRMVHVNTFWFCNPMRMA